MPVPQENLSFVEQASCLLLTMVQDISRNKLNYDTAYIAVLKKVRYALCPMPYALCPMPYAHEYLIFLRKAISAYLLTATLRRRYCL